MLHAVPRLMIIKNVHIRVVAFILFKFDMYNQVHVNDVKLQPQ